MYNPINDKLAWIDMIPVVFLTIFDCKIRFYHLGSFHKTV